MHQTASDRFGQTDYNMSENHDRPAFQRPSNQYNMDGEEGQPEGAFDQQQQEQQLIAQQELEDQQKMFSFEDN